MSSAAPVSGEARSERSRVLAWAFYDWGNSAFATTVVAGFFPVFFKDYWSADLPAVQSTFLLSLGVSLASLVVALLAPALGVVIDRGSSRRALLIGFGGIGVLATAGLSLIPRGAWLPAIVTYAVAFCSWLLSLVVYDSLLLLVSRRENVDRVSGLGYALGYLGGGLLFAVNAVAVSSPATFGLVPAGTSDEALLSAARVRAVQWSFLSVAIWWTVFALPLLLRVADGRRGNPGGTVGAFRQGFAEVRGTFRAIRRYRHAFLFLLAFWLYIDGVDTVYTMAVDLGRSLGFATSDLLSALLLVQFVAFPFAWAYGWLAGRIGTRAMILAGLATYGLVTALATQITTTPVRFAGITVSQFHLLALLVGTAQGGVQALSRSLFTRLIPHDKAGEFFGFYNLVGRFAAILGPLLLGVVTRATGDPRLGMGSIGLLLGAGALMLWRLDVSAGEAEAAR